MPKTIIEGKVESSNQRIFTVHKVGASEQDIQLHFDAAVDYRVVKLDVDDLPVKDKDGHHITWINNFGIMDSSGEYVGSVNYTVFLPAKGNAQFIYQDRAGLKEDKTPRETGSKPAKPGKVQVDFNTGDPGVGWR